MKSGKCLLNTVKPLVLKSFIRLCAGNLYSREVQVDGEQVTIQVQDTPGAEVRATVFSSSLLRQEPDGSQFIFPCAECKATELTGLSTRISVEKLRIIQYKDNIM